MIYLGSFVVDPGGRHFQLEWISDPRRFRTEGSLNLQVTWSLLSNRCSNFDIDTIGTRCLAQLLPSGSVLDHCLQKRAS